MSIQKLLGERIKRLRQGADLTQEQLAEKVGIESASYVSKIEKGGPSPSFELLARIAEVLGVSLKDLFDIRANHPKEKKRLKPIDKWLLKYRILFKGKNEKDVKAGYYVLKKIFDSHQK